jgi:hypothetical protein
MSFDNPRRKAFCGKVEQALWILMGTVIFGCWCFAIWKAVTS